MSFLSPGFARPQPSGREERAAAIAQLRRHPDMPKALRVFCTGLTGVAQANRLLNLIVSDRYRMVMTMLTLYLDGGYDPRDPLSGLTVNRYKTLCARAGISSPGRGAAMLGLMRFAGHLEPATRARRGQPLRLVPTEKLLGPQRARLRFAFTALSHLRPEGRAGLAMVEDPAHLRILIRAIGDQFLMRERMIEHAPGLTFFSERKAGLLMLMCLMLASAPDEDLPPTGPIAVSIKELARRVGVARSQVRDMLRGGVAAGLLEPDGHDETAYLMTSRLRDGVVGFIAAIFLLFADAVRQAQAEIAAGNRAEDEARASA